MQRALPPHDIAKGTSIRTPLDRRRSDDVFEQTRIDFSNSEQSKQTNKSTSLILKQLKRTNKAIFEFSNELVSGPSNI